MSEWCTVSEYIEIRRIRCKPVKSRWTVIKQIKEADARPEIFLHKTRRQFFGRGRYLYEIELTNDVEILILERLRNLEKEGHQNKEKVKKYTPVKCKATMDERLILKNSRFRKALLCYILENENTIQVLAELQSFTLVLPTKEYNKLLSMAESKNMTTSDVLVWYLRLFLKSLEGKALFDAYMRKLVEQSNPDESSDLNGSSPKEPESDDSSPTGQETGSDPPPNP
ncbi:MAG: hypothetical protein HY730_02805 [Candidatus Tectomicrobia bacterium]|uniref:Uncharacterized protein n=1 Tax=Tectimicrobiota bacterium TaxID=2528274 RepID=A0A933LPN0_UNCTE|nr:hypothetical protein [Candidatus Tectomicrobia bacterium]